MKMGAPEQEQLCLECHATYVPEDRQAKTFQMSDGVGCESCHGPSSEWLGPHTRRDWTRQQSLAAGMTDTRDLEERTSICSGCHIGGAGRNVDHELIAAGHPALIFETETFSALMPKHWREESDDWAGARRWIVGQATALREEARQLNARASGPAWEGWPDFADFDCFSCHHDLVVPTWRQNRPVIGRAGSPPWNHSRYQMLSLALGQSNPTAARELTQIGTVIQESMLLPLQGRQEIIQQTQNLVAWADRAIPTLEGMSIDQAIVGRWINGLAQEAEIIAYSGLRSVEQATMAIDTLYRSWRETTGQERPALDTSIEALYQSLSSTSGFSPDDFARRLRSTAALFQP